MSHSGTGVIESTADGCKTMPGTSPGVLYDSVIPHLQMKWMHAGPGK